MRIKNEIRLPRVTSALLTLIVVLCFSCSEKATERVARTYNDKAYHFHYISLDSTLRYTHLALECAPAGSDAHMEALNNCAFVDIIRMDYEEAEEHLLQIIDATDNEFERLVANVQMMRLCQRKSENKNFYEYYWQAVGCIDRINEDAGNITPRQRLRFEYAKSEFTFILSAYLYYVEQIEASIKALDKIGEICDIKADTAQLMNYYYNVGSGGYLTDGTPEEIAVREFEYLVRCLYLARTTMSVYWEANVLQAMSEHLLDNDQRQLLLSENVEVLKHINTEHVADSLLAGNLALRSAKMFANYGDIYQTAGTLRTLADCYRRIGKYDIAIECLHKALERDTAINQAPALTSSIYEKLSMNYSALDDKPSSDYYRNLYLDSQWNTRQDRALEARAEQLRRKALEQNLMTGVVCAAIVVMFILLAVFSNMRRNSEKKYTTASLLAPLETWKSRAMASANNMAERHEQILEAQQAAELMLERNIQRNLELRAKMALVNSITPFIDRMLAEMQCLISRNENEAITKARYAYILELTGKINEYNGILTQWIQMRKGELSLKIESFRMQQLMDIVKKSRHTFNMKGVELIVDDTPSVVKADRTLTLFMINTIADNARKASHQGGTVRVSTCEGEQYVEISVTDTGTGMTEQQLKRLFSKQVAIAKTTDETEENYIQASTTSPMQHGFGLMNCKGIIEKYRKISPLFAVCNISAKSELGKGTTIGFRLPKGIARTLFALIMSVAPLNIDANNASAHVADKTQSDAKTKAAMFADSIYFANLQEQYDKSIAYADSARTYLNIYYKQLRPKGNDLMQAIGKDTDKAAELKWYEDSLAFDYKVILDIRNETAVAALALHKWDTYSYNNKVYSRLFRECSADPTLLEYVGNMNQAGETRRVAFVILTIMLLSILPAYYMLYYRHKMHYRFLVDNIGSINQTLMSSDSDEEKLAAINQRWSQVQRYLDDTKEANELQSVVEQIEEALENNINALSRSSVKIELAEDELHRMNFEADRLHVSNNVLDNCFSTLKHETMYYPSRIRQMVENNSRDVGTLHEITAYYKELYMLLSLQAQRQLETNVRMDKTILTYLMSLLRKLSGEKMPNIIKADIDRTYCLLTVEMPGLRLTEEQVSQLFTPQTCQLTCLIVRQIIREAGDTTNHRGCGVRAEQRTDGGTDIIITISRKVKLAPYIPYTEASNSNA